MNAHVRAATAAPLLVLAAVLPVVSAPPAAACSCVASPLAAQVRGADVALVGRLLSVEQDDRVVRYTLDVERAWDDRVGASVVVESTADGGSCGLGVLRTGERWLMLTHELEGRLHTSICEGSTPAGQRVVERATSVLGRGERPSGVGRFSDDPGPSTSSTAALVVGALAVGGVAAAGGGLLVARRRRRSAG